MSLYLSRWAKLTQFPTRHELLAERVIATLGVPYRFQPMLSPFFPDFLFPEHRVILEIDGKSHLTKEGVEKDRVRDAILSERGYVVVRVTNEEVEGEGLEWFQRLQDALGAAERRPVEYRPAPGGRAARTKRSASER